MRPVLALEGVTHVEDGAVGLDVRVGRRGVHGYVLRQGGLGTYLWVSVIFKAKL